MIKWITNNKKSIIRGAFLVPILAVSAVSISHVVSWYDLANPISWAIYLSIAVELAAMSSIAAASAKVKGFSVWIVFIIVTLIQLVGNIYFSYSEIDLMSKEFKDWAELTKPIFDMISPDSAEIGQRRLLALLEGGLLPLISLTCLHFFIQYGESDSKEEIDPRVEGIDPDKIDTSSIFERISKLKEEGKLETPTEEDIEYEPTAMAYTYNVEEEDQAPELIETSETISDDIRSIIEDDYIEDSLLLDLIEPQIKEDDYIVEIEENTEVELDELEASIQTIPGDGANIQSIKPIKKAPRLYLDDDKK
jgi:hypothetical protein